MSKFLSEKYSSLVPYVPGEQPKDMEYIKLNTNESPFPPPENVDKKVMEEVSGLQLYPDPECTALNVKLAGVLNVSPDEILATNGSDEILNFAFMAFCDKDTSAVFPDITYGFYKVFAGINNVPYTEIPLDRDFKINPDDYKGINKTVFIANPNAPTGIILKCSEIEEIIKSNPDNIVVVDEAYIDFGGESCVPLIHKYDNLLVTQTFSKSRSMAGARLGFGVAAKPLIRDLNAIKYSTNPYNINRLTVAAALATLSNDKYNKDNCRIITENRAYLSEELKKIGFILTDSRANFVFAAHPEISGRELYLKLKEKGILIRHFDTERISCYNRITVGTKAQLDALIAAVKEILKIKD